MAALLFVAGSFLAAMLASAQATFSGPCNTYEAEKLNEGYYSCVYCHAKIVPGENCTWRYKFRNQNILPSTILVAKSVSALP